MDTQTAEIFARSSDGAAAALGVGLVVLLVVLYAGLIFAVFYVYSRIVKKAGYPWPWIFIMLVPVVNIVMICMFALKEWPIERELARTRAALAVETGSPYPDPSVYGFTDYPIDYADTQRFAGAIQPGGYPTQGGSPFGPQYPAPDASQGYSTPGQQGYASPGPQYGLPDTGWQGQNDGLYGTPDQPGDGKQNPWAPKG